MSNFNVVVHNEKIQNVSATISYVFECLLTDKDMFLLIDESPDLEQVCLGQEYFLSVLQKLCDKFKYKQDRISIEIENLVQSDCWPNIKRCYRSVDVLHGQNIAFEFDKKISYKTSLLVAGSRWPRLSIASYLYHNHRNDSLITYWQNLKDTKQPCYLYLDDLFKNHMQKGIDNDFIDRVNQFVQALPIHLEDSDKQENKNTGYISFTKAYEIMPWYNRIFCDVVCETVHNGQTFAFTEKSARCWLSKTPFLVFGPKNYLSNIRKLGFMTFGSFWSESYDRYENTDRINIIQKQIDHIHQMDYQQLTDLYWSDEMQNILENNNKVFQTLSQDKIRKVFDLS